MVWIVLLICCSIVLSGYFLIPKSTKPKKPKLEVSETYKLGWWTKQEMLTVSSFQVEVVESRVYFFNKKRIIKYNIKRDLIYKEEAKPIIKKVHVSERFLNLSNSSINSPIEAFIEITPIIEVVDDKKYKGEVIQFDITNEKIINSFRWGDNTIRFKCLDKNYDIILTQLK